jgi:hypothetical protein
MSYAMIETLTNLKALNRALADREIAVTIAQVLGADVYDWQLTIFNQRSGDAELELVEDCQSAALAVKAAVTWATEHGFLLPPPVK